MHRFYYPNADFSNKKIVLNNPEELHHLKNVLRLKVNSQITIFNGNAEEALGVITRVSSHEAVINILDVKVKTKKNMPHLILACAIPKKSKFEIIIEKCTELGVDEIIPLMTQRTEVNLKDERLDKKLVRYQTIAVSAAKQSHRLTVPQIHPPMKFREALELLSKTSTVLIPSLCGEPKNLLKTLEEVKHSLKISFLIGPEGDFTPEEYALAQEKGAKAVTLGNTVLRVETAAISSISCANLYFSV
ncbi:MAG: 16S rRNA (uracil(1498)-N(3))-methyltransferase [Candidatus Omnitrophica bacterium]|nr:16S rRNA (uracil(1498)-N(3))-methyltransferase [Candidatus Omnitrophota bacterium]